MHWVSGEKTKKKKKRVKITDVEFLAQSGFLFGQSSDCLFMLFSKLKIHYLYTVIHLHLNFRKF